MPQPGVPASPCSDLPSSCPQLWPPSHSEVEEEKINRPWIIRSILAKYRRPHLYQ